MNREPVVIEEGGKRVWAVLNIAMGLCVLCSFPIILFFLLREGPEPELCYLLVVIPIYFVQYFIVDRDSNEKKKFVISERGIEYWKPGLILFQAPWKDIYFIETQGKLKRHGGLFLGLFIVPRFSPPSNSQEQKRHASPLLEIHASCGSYEWRTSGPGAVSGETLRKVFDHLADWARGYPHIKVVKTGDTKEETELLQEGQS